jgi:hypothetical protein
MLKSRFYRQPPVCGLYMPKGTYNASIHGVCIMAILKKKPGLSYRRPARRLVRRHLRAVPRGQTDGTDEEETRCTGRLLPSTAAPDPPRQHTPRVSVPPNLSSCGGLELRHRRRAIKPRRRRGKARRAGESDDLSHRVPGSNGARNGNVERGTPIFNTWWNDEYIASARSKSIWIVFQTNLERCSGTMTRKNNGFKQFGLARKNKPAKNSAQ